MPDGTDTLNSPTGGAADQLCHAAAILAAQLLVIADHQCKIQPIDLFVLWHIKDFGKMDSEGRPVMPRQHLTVLLRDKLRYSEGDISKRIGAMHDAGNVAIEKLTTQERDALFGATGQKLAVRLLPRGSAKIEQFKAILQQQFASWLSKEPTAVQQETDRFVEPIALRLSQWLLDHFRPTPQ